MSTATEHSDLISLYFSLKPNENIDLEVGAAAAIEWSRAIKAAARAVEPSYNYRVILIEARVGSSNWLAKIERSGANQFAKDAVNGFNEVPLILRLTVAAAVFVGFTGKPTYDHYFAESEFSDTELGQIQEAMQAALADSEFKSHQQSMYRELQRDKNIIAVGGGIPSSDDWTPLEMIPSNRFAEADGLFDAQIAPGADRTIYQVLDVVLVTPQLVKAKRAWVFRQEGLPGKITAIMSDMAFLDALEDQGIEEKLRVDIPMRIRLKIVEENVNGEWKVKSRGRYVVEVLSPRPDTVAQIDHSTTPTE